VTVSANVDFNVALDNFKQTYAPDLQDNRPAFMVLQELLKANRGNFEMGAKVNIPVLLSHQGGESYGLSGDTSNLGSPVSLEIKDAQSDQFEITLPVRMPFGMISKAQQSEKARFADKARLLLLAGDTGAKRANELALLHGRNSFGKILNTTGSSGTTLVVQLTPDSWSDGIWGAADNLPFDTYSNQDATGTKRNANADFNLTAVDFANRKLTFTGNASDVTATLANDFIVPRGSGAATAKVLPGLMYQAALGAGSTHLNISTNYTMWRAKAVPITGAITFGKLVSGISPAVAHGADGKFVGLASPRNYADLIKDLASARRLDASYSETKMKNGAQAVEYRYLGVTITMVVHPFMKDGEVVLLPPDNWFRIGSDPDPVMKLGDVPLQVMSSSANVIEWRFWSAQALMPNLLATTVYFSGITPNAS
jgi:hypothetical protein